MSGVNRLDFIKLQYKFYWNSFERENTHSIGTGLLGELILYPELGSGSQKE